MKVAFVGTRGVPASYSGFETCVEQLGRRLAERGHDVTVYCRSHHIQYEGDVYLGMKLVRLPTIRNKYLDTILHTFLSLLHGLTQPYDVVLMFIVGNAPLTFIPRLRGQKVIINVDGLDWKRDKWPALAKRYILFSEWVATWMPHAFLTDSRVVQQYYRDTYQTDSPYIPYGSNVKPRAAGSWLSRFGLEPRRYMLFVGRLVPENNIHHLLEAFHALDTDMKCVVVGNAAYADDYIAYLKAVDDPRVVFTGYVFGEGYEELGSNAYAFIETSGVGGTHPALIEAMAFGNCVIANGTPENRETLGDAGFVYDGQEGGPALQTLLASLLADALLVAEYRERARARAEACFDWDRVADAYEALCVQVLDGPHKAG